MKTIKEIKLFTISLVSTKKEIKSQHIANLLQIFPTNCKRLPKTHKSDKEFNVDDYI